MLKRIEPEAVICYCSVFPEMEGKIIEVGYAQTNHLKHKFLIEHSDINHAIIESNSWIGIQKRQSYYVKKRMDSLLLLEWAEGVWAGRIFQDGIPIFHRERILNGEEPEIQTPAKEVGIIQVRKKSCTQT